MKQQVLDRPLIIKNQKVGSGSPNIRVNEDGELSVVDFDVENLKPELEKLRILKTQFMRGKWSGEDIGSAEMPVRDVYTKGEYHGFRLQNFGGVAPASGKSVGRLTLNVQDEKIYCDLGYKTKRVSSEKFELDVQVSNPSEEIEIDLKDSDIDDARKTIWQVCRNAEGFERISAKIKTPDEKKLLIKLPEGSEAGSYRVLGVE